MKIMHTITVASLAAWLLVACSAERSPAEHFEKAKEYRAAGKLDAATLELKNVLQADSNNLEARALLGQVYFERGDFVSADAELQRATDVGAPDELVLPLRAQVLLSLAKHEELATIDPSLLAPEGRATVLAAQGLSQMVRSRTEQGALLIDQAASIKADLPFVGYAQASLFVWKGQMESAREKINAVLRQDTEYVRGWDLLGDIEQATGHIESAESAYTRAIELNQDGLDYYFKRALTRVRAGNYSGAQQDIDVVAKAAPDNPRADFIQGLIRFQQRNIAEAKPYFESAAKAGAGFPAALYYLAVSYVLQGDLEQARQYAAQYTSADPDSIAGRKLSAVVQIQLGRHADAERLLRPVVLANNEDTEAMNLLATALQLQGKSDEALEVLSKVAAVSPDSPAAQMRLGAGLSASGDAALGEQRLAEALRLDPESERAAILLAFNLLQQGDTEAALREATAFAERNPENAVAYNLLGQCYLASGAEDKAIQAFKQALSLSPGDPAASHSLAALSLKNRDVGSARSYYESVLSHRANYLPTMIKLAALEALAGNEPAMLKVLERAKAASPEAVEPRLVLARYHLSRGEAQQALDLLSEMDDRQRRLPSVLGTLGMAQLATKRYQEAAMSLEGAVADEPDDAQIHYELALAYAGLNNKDKAIAELEKAVALDVKHVPARLALARAYSVGGQNERFEQQLSALRNLAPGHPGVLLLEAVQSNAKGNPQQALGQLRDAFEKSPSHETMIAIARQFLAMGKEQDGQAVLEQWIGGHPDDTTARMELANIYVKARQFAAAAEQYEQVLAADRDNVLALNNLAWGLSETQPQKALGYAERAAELAPGSVEVMDTLAVVLLRNGDVQRATRTIERALSSQPGAPTLLFHKAMIQKAGGDSDGAKATLEAALKGADDFAYRADAEALLDSLR